MLIPGLLPGNYIRPSVRVSDTAVQSIAHNTFVAVGFNKTIYDPFSIHNDVTNNSRLTLPFSGQWWFWASLAYASGGTGYRMIQFKLNGATNFDADRRDAVGSTVFTYCNLGAGIEVTAGDYMELMAKQTQGSARNTVVEDSASPIFGAFYISP